MSKLGWTIGEKGIGGSDAAAVIGISPYKTARDVYFRKKVGREPDNKTEDGWDCDGSRQALGGFGSGYLCKENRFPYLAGKGNVSTSLIPLYAGGCGLFL